MKRIIFSLWFIVYGLWPYVYAQVETLTLLTYYPAPYGIYQNLNVTQRVWIGTDGAGNPLSGGAPLLQVGGTIEGEDALGILIYATGTGEEGVIFGEGTALGSSGILGRNTNSAGFGVTGWIVPGANGGTAIRALNFSPTGAAIGVFGDVRSSGAGTYAVQGWARSTTGVTYAVYGLNDSTTDLAAGIYGFANGATGKSYGVYGKTISTTNGATGVYGEAGGATGLTYGVYGRTVSNTDGTTAVYGEASGTGKSYGVYGSSANYVGVYGSGPSYAGFFSGRLYASGNVGIGITPTAKLHVNGNIKAVLTNFAVKPLTHVLYDAPSDIIGYDVAELFETNKEVIPGDVLTIDSNGKLKKCDKPNDTSVAGIVSSAPAILFEGSELQIAPEPFVFEKGTKPPLSLSGRVLCNVSAENGSIVPGDLLTTSATPGHAMKTKQIGETNGYPIYPQGCIVGKALEPLKEGKGKILVLVCLM